MAEINKNDLVSAEALAVIDLLRAKVKQLQTDLIAAMNAGKAMQDGLGNQDKISGMAAEIKNLNANILSLTQSATNLAQAQKALESANAKFTTSTKAETTATKENTKAKTTAAATNKTEAASRRNATNASKNHATATQIENRATRELAASIRAKTALQKAEDAATIAAIKSSKALAKANGEEEKTTKSLGGSIKNLLGSLVKLGAAYLTVQGLISLFNKFRDATKDLDSLRFAMSATIQNTFELAQSQHYLLDISKKYGLSIVEITNSYTKFRAAVNESNMTIDEGQKVFGSMAKSSAVLGLTVDKTNDIFLALEQMVGKGSIMSEELRRQMGQHLPVAMTAMASAAKMAGISVSGSVEELMKLMKAGKVAASEILPYFGDAVEEQLKIKGVNSVNTLATAQANLTLAWMEFVKAMNSAPVLTKVYTQIGNSVQWLANIIKSEAAKIQEGAGSIVSDVNDQLVLGTSEKEKQAILDAEIVRLNERKLQLARDQEGLDKIVPLDNRTNANKIEDAVSGKVKAALGLPTTYKPQSRALETYINETAAIDAALKLIQDNYADLIKMKEQKPLLPDTAAIKKAANDALKVFKDKQAEELADYIVFQQQMKANAYKLSASETNSELDNQRIEAGLSMELEENVAKYKMLQNKNLQDYYKGSNAKMVGIQAQLSKDVEGLTEEEVNNRMTQQKELEEYMREGKVNLADAEREYAQIVRDLTIKETDFSISEFDREFKAWQDNKKRMIEEQKDQDIADIEVGMNQNILGMAEALPKGPIRDQRAYGQVEQQFNIDVLTEQEAALKKLLNVENLTINEQKKFQVDLANTQEALEKAKRDQIQKTFDLQKELTAEAFEFGSEAMNETFGLFTAIQDGKMQKLEWQYEREKNLAGEDVAARIGAENRYDKEKRKLMKRQAILQKAQAAANIIMNTAAAIVATLGQTGIFGLPLTPIIAGIGSLQLAAVLAQPIPAYELGGRHEGGPARFSEKGRELFIPDGNGNPLLTPVDETVAVMPAGKFIPADETQRILVQNAMSNFMKTDMSPTNSLLKNIVDKTEVKYAGGYKITKTGRYATRS